jgi:hypothetical protein
MGAYQQMRYHGFRYWLLLSSSPRLCIEHGASAATCECYRNKAWYVTYIACLPAIVCHTKRKQPMPPHNLFLGHLGLAATIQSTLPSNAHGHYLATQIQKRYPALGPTFYLDLWPISDPILAVTDPAVIAQFSTADRLLPKHPGVKTFLYPITGGYDLNCLEGETWRTWRKLFNPGFSAGHIQTLVPTIVNEINVFRELLFEKARKGAMFSFEELTLNLSIDMIGRVALYVLPIARFW